MKTKTQNKTFKIEKTETNTTMKNLSINSEYFKELTRNTTELFNSVSELCWFRLESSSD